MPTDMLFVFSASRYKGARPSHLSFWFLWITWASSTILGSIRTGERSSDTESEIDDLKQVRCRETAGAHQTFSRLKTGLDGLFENGLDPSEYQGSLTKFCASNLHGGLLWANMGAYCDNSGVGVFGPGLINFSQDYGDPLLLENFQNKLICTMYCHCEGNDDGVDLFAHELALESDDEIQTDAESESTAFDSFLQFIASDGFFKGGEQSQARRTHHRPGYYSLPRICQVKTRCPSYSCAGPDGISCDCVSRVVGGVRQRQACAGKKSDPRLYVSMGQSIGG